MTSADRIDALLKQEAALTKDFDAKVLVLRAASKDVEAQKQKMLQVETELNEAKIKQRAEWNHFTPGAPDHVYKEHDEASPYSFRFVY